MRVDPVSLSAHIDGEVQQPFSAQIDALIEAEPEARRHTERLRTARSVLPRLSEDHISQSALRSWAIISARIPRGTPAVWRRRVSLPLPALIGAAAALVAFVGVSIWSFLPERADATDYLTNTSGVDVTIRVDGNDMEQVLQWLVDKNMLGEVNIQLPEQRFQIVGEPVLLKPDVPEEIEQ